MSEEQLLPPIHPGEILLEEFLEPLGISQYRLAKDISVPARRYAVFAHRGPVSTVTETFDAIWHTWLPKSGLEIDGPPQITEVYGESFDPKTGTGGFEIWIAIKA